jgi:hypothetical protein
LKMSVNSFTRELAISMSTIGRSGNTGSGAASPQARAEKVSGLCPRRIGRGWVALCVLHLLLYVVSYCSGA